MLKSDEALTLLLKQIELAEREARIADARESFPHFCEYVMIDNKGHRWNFAPHQHEWSALMDDPNIELLELVGPRGCAKSTTLQARVLHELGRNPDLCIKYVCGDDALAIDRLMFLRNSIETNRRYHEVFPHVKPEDMAQWTKHKVTIQRPSAAGLQDASIECSSVTSAGTGTRCDLLILDDVINAATALTRPGTIHDVKQHVEQDWMSTLHPGGRVWLIGTFWSFDPPDLYVEYAHSAAWRTWCKPACRMDSAGNLREPVLWPEKWPLKALESRRTKVGSLAFRQQYLLEGAVQRSDYFAKEHIQASKVYSYTLGQVPFELAKIGMGMDPATALTANSGSFACIVVVGLGTCGRRIPLAILRLKADPAVITDALLQQYVLWSGMGVPVSILVENNATQKTFETLAHVIGEGRGMTGLPIMGQHVGSNKWSAEGGLPGLNAELAQGKWVIPFGGDHVEEFCQCPVCLWLWELEYFRKPMDGRGQKPTTDTVMAWWLASTAVGDQNSIGDVPIFVERETRSVRYEPAYRSA